MASRHPPIRAEIRHLLPSHSTAPPPPSLPEREQSYQRRVGDFNSQSTGWTVIHRSRIRSTGARASAARLSRGLRPGRSGPAQPVRRLLRRPRARLRAVPAGDHPTSVAPPRPGATRASPCDGGCRLRRSRPVMPARLQGAGPARPGPTVGCCARGGDRRARRRTDVARARPVRGRRGPSPRWPACRSAGTARSPHPSPAWCRCPRRACPGTDRRPTGRHGTHGR